MVAHSTKLAEHAAVAGVTYERYDGFIVAGIVNGSGVGISMPIEEIDVT